MGVLVTVRDRQGRILNEHLLPAGRPARRANQLLTFLPPRRGPRPPLLPSRMPPAVSFIIPAHNAEATIAEAVASCFAQTMGDLEVVVVDDGSTDGTAAVLAGLQEQYDARLCVVRQEQCGAAAARNEGIRQAAGANVIFLDADDVAPHDRAQASLEAIRAGADLVYGQEEEFDDAGGLHGLRRRSAGIRAPDCDNILGGCGFRTGTVAARRDLFTRRGVWLDERMAGAEDYELLLAALAAGAVVHCSDEVLLWRRQRPGTLRSRCNWSLLRAYAADKHRVWLEQYTRRPGTVSNEQRAEIARQLAAAGAEKMETGEGDMKVICGDVETLARETAASRAPELLVMDEALGAEVADPVALLERLLPALADPSVGLVAPLLRASSNPDQAAQAEGEGWLRTRRPPVGLVAIRRAVLEEVGGLREEWGDAWALHLGAALMARHYRLLLHRATLVEAQVKLPKVAVRAFERQVAPLEDLPACHPDPEFTVVLEARGATATAVARAVALCHEAGGPAVEVAVVGGPVMAPPHDFLAVPHPGTLAAAYNRGIRRGLGTLLLLLKVGDTVTPETFAAAREQLREHDLATAPVPGAPSGHHLAGVVARREVFTQHALWLAEASDEDELGTRLVRAATMLPLRVARLDQATTRAGHRLSLRSAPDRHALLAWEQTPLIIVSTCGLDVTGGGQRPAQFARALSLGGDPVIYFNDTHDLEWRNDNLLLLNRDGYVQAAEALRAQRGAAVYGLPDLRRWVPPLGRNWTGVFDLCDDWEEFSRYGHLPHFDLNEYREVLRTAPLVVCSAQRLVEIAQAHGAPQTVLIRNGGPAHPILAGDCERPAALLEGEIKVVYLGSTWGAWMDWEGLSKLALDLAPRGGVINLIGSAYQGQIPNHPNVRWHGELPLAQALPFVAHSDVGVVPFRGEKLCRAVDPVKYYDYVAAGCRVVAADVLTELRGRPWCHLAPSEGLAAAVFTAMGLPRIAAADAAQFCRDNSWNQRAEALRAAVKRLLA